MLAPILKAVCGAAVAGIGAALAYLQGGGHSPWLAALYGASAALTALGVIYRVPNAQTKKPGS